MGTQNTLNNRTILEKRKVLEDSSTDFQPYYRAIVVKRAWQWYVYLHREQTTTISTGDYSSLTYCRCHDIYTRLKRESSTNDAWKIGCPHIEVWNKNHVYNSAPKQTFNGWKISTKKVEMLKLLGKHRQYL